MEGWINVCSLSGRRIGKIPDEIHPVKDGWTHCDSLAAITTCDPSDDTLFDTTSMAALVGIGKYRLEDIFAEEGEFSFVYRNKTFYATYSNSLSAAWDQRTERIYQGQLKRAGKAGEHRRRRHVLD